MEHKPGYFRKPPPRDVPTPVSLESIKRREPSPSSKPRHKVVSAIYEEIDSDVEEAYLEPCVRELEEESWYFDVGRSEAERMLYENGMFLVRPRSSDGADSAYALSVYWIDRVHHVRIECVDGAYGFHSDPEEADGGRVFSTVPELIHYYLPRPVTIMTSKKLEIHLSHSPLRQEEQDDDDEDDYDDPNSPPSIVGEDETADFTRPPSPWPADRAIKPRKVVETSALRRQRTQLRPVSVIFNAAPPGEETLKQIKSKGVRSNSDASASSTPQRSLSNASTIESTDSDAVASDVTSDGGTLPLQRLRPFPKPRPPIKLEDELWYFDIGRDSADEMLNTDGDYLIRPSTSGGSRFPYVLCVFFRVRVFHLQIRKRENNRLALGTPYEDEKTFSSVREMIKYHHKHHIILLEEGRERQILLRRYPPRDSRDQRLGRDERNEINTIRR